MIKTQKPITFINICGAIVDFEELAKAILWYSDHPVCSIKKDIYARKISCRKHWKTKSAYTQIAYDVLVWEYISE